MTKSSRFDHVEFDQAHDEMRKEAKQLCLDLESFIDQIVPGRPKSLALTALEESYMWIGKAIRDDQISFDQNQKATHELSAQDGQGRPAIMNGMPVILTGD